MTARRSNRRRPNWRRWPSRRCRPIRGSEGLTVDCRPVVDELNRDARALLVPLFGFVALVFFVACVNVAGLFVARGLQRHREYAMRAALGASRLRLFRQVITESAALSMLGAVVGAGLAVGIVVLFKAVGGDAIPRADTVTVGWPVFAFGCVGGAHRRVRLGLAAGAARVFVRPRARARKARAPAPGAWNAGCSARSPRCRSCSRWRSWPARRC